ncbi:MAG: FAD-dependent oxidoreductase, partial [Acidobacteria bacterium]|nr:FAD-dependent oxidoreductase [Acidobacteriota bacterium]
MTVIGAGAFGGWTALELVRRGARVTLIDAWGPGNARASSGGETRVIRATYGTRSIYTAMAARALDQWRAHDERWQRRFFQKTGALWMFGRDDSFGRASVESLRARRMSVEELTPADAKQRYPQINFDGIASVVYEPDAGYLLARRACEHVAERVVAEGGTYRQAAVAGPVRINGTPLRRVTLQDGGSIEADAFVFACGPWLGALFPDVIGALVKPTRQEVYYFGTAPGDTRFQESQLPVWVDFRDRLFYGIPGNVNRGFKVADDTAGPLMDPTSG